MKKLLTILIILLSITGAFAQGGGTEDNKASKFYEEAR